MRSGTAYLLVKGEPRQSVRLKLTEDTLFIQKQEYATHLALTENIDISLLDKERVVLVHREKPGGLGLSVKGGAEHGLPILVSRIFKDQAADKTGQLYVGDAIIEVNGVNVESFCHDESVMVLKNAGDDVRLTVRFFQPASYFLTTTRNSSTLKSKEDTNNSTALDNEKTESESDKRWVTVITLPLLCAYISRYKAGSPEISCDCFEVINLNGTISATIQFDDTNSCEEWARTIYYNVVMQNQLSIALTNRPLLTNQRVMHMCWVNEKLNNDQSATTTWRRLFLSLKGPEVSFYETPPVKTRDWVRCEKSCKIYECMFKILKGSELLDNRPNCFLMETASDDNASHCLSVETHEELLKLEKAWYKTNYHAVKLLGSKTFGCTCKGRLSGLTLDFSSGFCLYESETKTCTWSYRFSQLKGSSDNGQTKLKLQFLNESTNQIDTWEMDCTELKNLLYCIHSFLSAKLASVDPIFLINL